jgi:PII-like signaling protein
LKLRGNSREIYMKAKGGYQDLAHSDQMILKIVRQGGLTASAVAKRISGGGHQARVHSDQMALMIARLGGWTNCAVPKDTPS